jgi:hypothetical protein
MMNTNATTKETTMTTYAIYQIPEDTPMNLIRDISFFTPAEVEAVSDQHEFVGTIEAKNLNQVFRIGNFECTGDELDQVKSLPTMRSVSVGDIIHNLETDETHVVARFGFEKITMKEAA